ncbi:MAG: NADH-quinone oxidoreductase subunit C [Firmicutes bacterium]|nr:NADH-quinone oxidoreductase subunit C [Bacillota bacterium]
MGNAQLIDSLVTRFPQKVTNIVTPRERRVFAETKADDLVEVARFLKEWGMINIGSITGLDGGERFEIIYHFYDSQGLILNLKVFTPRANPVIPSVTNVFPGVFLYERELIDLLGINVNGTPPGRRYPLPDDWPAGQYPLRKDWKGLPGQEGVN